MNFQRFEKPQRGRDDALAHVAHELRGPLAAIRAGAVLLAHHEPLDEHARRAVAIIAKNVAAQTRLIDDLIAHEQGARGLLHLVRAPVELTALAASAAESLRPVAAERGITLALESPHPVVVHGDAGRLRQVLYNLLTNAITHSPEGSQVALRVERDDEEAFIRVCDVGVGIAPAFLPFVFERFRRAARSTTSGLGLGLAITRDIVELHGGTIDVESTGAGRGTTFVVRLPRFDDTLPRLGVLQR